MKGIFGKLGKSRGLSVFIILLMIFSSFAVLGSISSATTAPPYAVTFNESKLPTGTTWGIVLSNSTKTITATNKTISTGGSISESLYNGTYYFNVTGTPWWFNSTHGKFTVAGATQTITINFIENFSATFTESGLYSGSKWMVSIGSLSQHTTSSSISFELAGGSYTYNVYAPWHYSIYKNATGTISLSANTTVNVVFNNTFPEITVKGYTIANATIYYPSIVNWKFNSTTANKTGYYTLVTTEYSFLIFTARNYTNQVAWVKDSKSGTYWLNISMQKLSTTWNISQIFSSSSTAFNFNFSKAPVNFTFTQNNITVTKLGANKFYFASLSLANKQVNITIPVMKYAHYIMQIYTNISSAPQITKFNATSNYYTFTWKNWSVDPLVQYSTPQAIITVPSVVAYDTAQIISGANSIASTNATITNWTWKITGPQNQVYTEYGKTITQYFSITGIYTITLTVTDSNGLTNTTSTTINVVSSNQDLKIKITYTLAILSNGYYEYNVTVDAQDNVSISQFLASVDGTYVNITLTKQTGYVYYYEVKFNPNSFGYGNHTIKFEAINSLDGYNTAVTYATFGSVNEGGIIAYLFGHIALTLVILIFIIIVLTFVYVAYKDRLVKKIRNSRRIKGSRRK